MSGSHNGGNLFNEINLEEHNGSLNAKRVDASTATIYAVVNTSAAGVGQSMVTLNAGPNLIGLVTIAGGRSNVTLNASNQFIGLVTALHGSNVTLNASAAYIGLASVNIGGGNVGITGNVTLSDSKNYIGLVTATIDRSDVLGGGTTNSLFASTASGTAFNARIIDGSGSAVQIGSVADGGSAGSAGHFHVTNRNAVFNGSSWDRMRGNASIGLKVDLSMSNATVVSQIVSNASATTIAVAPANHYFYIKDLMLGSLGASFPEIRSGATTLIPFMSLATSGGYVSNFGEVGLKSRAPGDALVVNMNSAVTVSIMANLRFATA